MQRKGNVCPRSCTIDRQALWRPAADSLSTLAARRNHPLIGRSQLNSPSLGPSPGGGSERWHGRDSFLDAHPYGECLPEGPPFKELNWISMRHRNSGPCPALLDQCLPADEGARHNVFARLGRVAASQFALSRSGDRSLSVRLVSFRKSLLRRLQRRQGGG